MSPCYYCDLSREHACKVCIHGEADEAELHTLMDRRAAAPVSEQPSDNVDKTALDVAAKIMDIVNGSWLPGGEAQIKAKVQCEIIDLLQRFKPMSGQPSITETLESVKAAASKWHPLHGDQPGKDARDAEKWRENVEHLLSSYPGSIRVCEGGGPEDLIASLCVTFTKLRDAAMAQQHGKDGA
jgi:hypothetical protein